MKIHQDSYELGKMHGHQELSLYEVCEWIVYSYPEDIFISTPIDELRHNAKKILEMRKNG